MRACIQRVTSGSVTIDGEVVSSINDGLVVLLGVAAGDRDQDAIQLADKISELRIFEDDAGKMNRSVLETGGQMLVVSQFTLLADCRKGRRPSFVGAAPPAEAERLYERFVEAARAKGVIAKTGRFRAMMQVALVNDGPVTIVFDTKE